MRYIGNLTIFPNEEVSSTIINKKLKAKNVDIGKIKEGSVVLVKIMKNPEGMETSEIYEYRNGWKIASSNTSQKRIVEN